MHDPLSDEPHQTYQAHRAAKRDGDDATQTGSTPPVPAAVAASAVISAEPQLRNLRKEAAAFVPRGVKRKKTAAAPGSSDIAATAPSAEGGAEDDGAKRNKPSTGINSAPIAVSAAPPTDSTTDTTSPSGAPLGGGLLGKLSSVLGPSPSELAAQQKKREEAAAPKQGDDYRAFLAGLDQLK
jgi:hypothetical protein